jgi:hypothetical protein
MQRGKNGTAFFESLHVFVVVIRSLIVPAAEENTNPVWPNNSSVTFFMRLFWLCFELFASLISRYALEKAAGLGHRISR